MGIKEGAGELRDTMLLSIKEAAQVGDSTAVTATSRLIEEVDRILASHETLEDRLKDVRTRFDQDQTEEDSPGKPVSAARDDLSAKAKGKLRRERLVRLALHLPVKR